MTGTPEPERPGEHGAASREGIVDQQDAVLHEMESEDGSDPEGVNDTERRFGTDESPA